MNGAQKTVGYNREEPPLDAEHLNPFIHRLELNTTYEKIKTVFFTVAVLPIRVAAICGLLVVAWCVACVGLYGVSDEDLREKPMTGWRKRGKAVSAKLIRWLLAAGSFHWVTVKGERAPSREAPILAVAPHSSFFDALAVVYLGGPSIVAKAEAAFVPFFGKLINYTQPVYVWREDAESRQNTIREISRRANSDMDWPQILIFPEGTCTNRSCLITFKCGAFYPGVPIQPVCIRYPNKLDTVTWTWEGPGALKLLWLTLTQVHSSCEIEFLPVYRPNAEEKANPKLFANNVRQVMAKALNVPVTNYTYDDCRLITVAQRLRLPLGGSLVELQRLRECLGLKSSGVEEKYLNRPVERTFVDRLQFAKKLGVPPEAPPLSQLFELCDTNSRGAVDWSEYLLTVLVLVCNGNLVSILRHMFVMMGQEDKGQISLAQFHTVTSRALSWTFEKSAAIFNNIASDSQTITFDAFETYAKSCEELSFLFRDSDRTRSKSE